MPALTFYDAVYVVRAAAKGVALVTADDHVEKAAKGLRVKVKRF